eukprot:SAG11_NODE_1866_length_4152_cov_15.643967_5_plen_60_part_00
MLISYAYLMITAHLVVVVPGTAVPGYGRTWYQVPTKFSTYRQVRYLGANSIKFGTPYKY